MQREITPRDFKMPNWLYSLSRGIQERLPSPWSYFWLGVSLAFGLLLFIQVPHDRFGEDWEIACCAIGMLLALFGWVTTGGRIRDNTEDFFRSWLKSKADADAWKREWSDEDLVILEKIIEWENNRGLNESDSERKRREEHWFWKNQKDGYGCVRIPEIRDSDKHMYFQSLLEGAKIKKREMENLSWKCVMAQEAASIMRLDQIEEKKLGQLYEQSEMALEVIETEAEECSYDWSNISRMVKLAGQSVLIKSIQEAMAVDEGERLTRWRKAWTSGWLRVKVAMQEALDKSNTHVRKCDFGRRLEIQHLEAEFKGLSEEERAQWEVKANAHNEHLLRLQQEAAVAVSTLQALALPIASVSEP
jgi:hypothetical protein